MKNFEIYNSDAKEIIAIVSEENIKKYNVDVYDAFSVGTIMPEKKCEFSMTRSNNIMTSKFDVIIEFNEKGHVSYFELRRDGGIICKGKNTLNASKFIGLMSKLGVKIDIYFENFEDIKNGLL